MSDPTAQQVIAVQLCGSMQHVTHAPGTAPFACWSLAGDAMTALETVTEPDQADLLVLGRILARLLGGPGLRPYVYWGRDGSDSEFQLDGSCELQADEVALLERLYGEESSD